MTDRRSALAHRLLLTTVAFAAIGATAACQPGEKGAMPADDEELSTQQGAIAYNPDTGESNYTSTSIPAGSCPDSTSSYTATELQKRATRAFKYVLKGTLTNPVSTWGCIASSSAKARLDDLRANANCTVQTEARAATVCGKRAVVYGVECYSTAIAADLMRKTSVELDKCWGKGASGFFNTAVGNVETRGSLVYFDVEMDPEPVVLTSSLSSTSGSTASGYYSNSGSSASVVLLNTTKTASSVPQPIGAPCSTTSRSSGSEVITTVQAYPNNSYRSCR